MGWILYFIDYRRYFLFNVIKHQFSLDWVSMGNTSIFMHVFVCKYIMNKSILVEGAPTKGMESLYVDHFFSHKSWDKNRYTQFFSISSSFYVLFKCLKKFPLDFLSLFVVKNPLGVFLGYNLCGIQIHVIKTIFSWCNESIDKFIEKLE